MKHYILFFGALLTSVISLTAGDVQTISSRKLSPKVFVQNKGQWPHEVQFLAQTGGMNAWITTKGIRYDFHVLEVQKQEKSEHLPSKHTLLSGSIRGHVVDMEFVGGNSPHDAPNHLQSAYFNYFIETDKSKWASNVPLFGEVTRREIYKGIDARLYFDGGYMRYDFNVGVSSNPNDIAIKLSGAQATKINSNGELVLKTSVGEVVHQKLFAYQEVNGERIKIECAFIPKGKNTYGFQLSSYDRSKPLVIDPILYSTYLGGSNADYGRDVGFDPDGNVVAVGTTMSTVNDRFPIKDGPYNLLRAPSDVYVTKLKADLSDVIFSTYYGSSAAGLATGNDEGTCCAVDNITGVIAFGGVVDGIAPGTGRDNSHHGMQDGFVAKINNNGSSLICGTNLGGVNDDRVNDLVTVPFTGEFVAVGKTKSTDYPITSGVVRTAMSTIFNSPRNDGFVTKLTATGAAYVFSTYIGIDSAFDECNGVALDKNNSIVVVGSTRCDLFPPSTALPNTKVVRAFLYGRGYRQNNTSTNFEDGFMIKLSTTGTTIEHGTLIGGDKSDVCYGVDVDQFGYAVICGNTQSSDIGANQFDQVLSSNTDGFALRINITGGGPTFVTYLGGSGDIEYMTNIKYLDQTGAMVVCGYTNSADFQAEILMNSHSRVDRPMEYWYSLKVMEQFVIILRTSVGIISMICRDLQ
ncbi:MAG: SBBP repeat-containing protein [Ignavibacteria bacterium]|nr:SBBP repeat-containing protein [Ignavibacteria bacterium]